MEKVKRVVVCDLHREGRDVPATTTITIDVCSMHNDMLKRRGTDHAPRRAPSTGWKVDKSNTQSDNDMLIEMVRLKPGLDGPTYAEMLGWPMKRVSYAENRLQKQGKIRTDREGSRWSWSVVERTEA